MARFDWYQGTVPAPLNDVLEAFLERQDGLQIAHTKGAHGFAHTAVLSDQDGTVAKVWYGGSHPFPHVILSGEPTMAGVEVIRARFPDHYVSRADACEDFADADAYDRLQDIVLQAAKQHRVKVDTRGDHLLHKEGRTVYLGAPTSACRLRLYDKAAELRSKFAKNQERLKEIPPHLARLEAQTRPQTREAKAKFARIEPLEVMGSSPWLRYVWHEALGLELTPVQVGKPWRQSDDDRAYAYLLAQYGGLIRRRIAEHGSPECFGRQLADDLARLEEAGRASNTSRKSHR